ncbi:hypothetical protein BD626DRAFT_473709 [Schizophyllum amplum]|uniref:Uncharacterized protein n=1 Tax=Schizophyllum amplum TaxID=97359 RepID=A0A550CX16_9AGAR|nr:hypothetical protein BD626DRAFT_473709 [Auriculariopsis ampla]
MQSTPAQDASASYTYVPIPSPPPGVSDGSSRQSQAVAWSTNDWNTEFGPSLTSATFDYHNDMPEPPHDERDRVQVLAARTISEGPQKQDDTQQQQWSQGDGGMGPPGGYQQQYQQQQQQEAAGPAKTTRIVTLLIQDMRSEEVDNQLAEVRIPLKGDQDGGFWADAKQVCEQLQNSPSRIDGPAKVYTLRGKYRQFFLRVTADNKDESTSMNLAVSADRTMDVVVETGYVPGTVPTRQKNPHELRAARSQESEREYFEPPARPSRESSSQNGRRRQPSNDFYAPPPPPPSDLRSQPSRYQEYQPPPGRKRKRSPSPDYSMPEDGDWYGMRYELQGKTPPRHIQYQRSKTSYDYNTPMWKKRRRPEDNGDDYKEPRPGPVIARVVRREPASDEEEEREYESPGPDDDEDRLHHKIAAAVDHEFLQKEPDWKEFFMARAKAQNVKNILTQYEIAHEMIVKYVGRDAPFRSCQYKVDTTHIMEALAIEDPRFPIDCADTLRLLRLYGPAGRRESHPQVIEMVNDDRPPEYNAKPMKRLLKLLKEVDQQYVASMRG